MPDFSLAPTPPPSYPRLQTQSLPIAATSQDQAIQKIADSATAAATTANLTATAEDALNSMSKHFKLVHMPGLKEVSRKRH